MRIWIVQTGEPLPDRHAPMRTGMLAAVLARRGHQVTWWTSQFDHLSKRWLPEGGNPIPLGEGLTAIGIRGRGYSSNVSIGRILDHRLVTRNWRRTASAAPAPDVAVVSMPPHDLAAAATALMRERGVPLILDLRDPWPDAWIELVPAPLRPLARHALGGEIRLLRNALTDATSIVAVSKALLAWGLEHGRRAAAPHHRVLYTGARPVVDAPPTDGVATLLNQLTGRFVVAFVGTFAFLHVPDVALAAARELPDVHFVLAGDGEKLAEMRREASGLANVHFPGWLCESDAAHLLASAAVGACPARRPLAVLPNKAAAYLRAGLPIVSSFGGDLHSIIEERQIGLNYPAGDARVFTRCISHLRDRRDVLEQMRSRARKTFSELFDATRITGQFADHVEHTAAARG